MFSLIHIATAVPNYAINIYMADYQQFIWFRGFVECVEKCGTGVEFFHKKVWKRLYTHFHIRHGKQNSAINNDEYRKK